MRGKLRDICHLSEYAVLSQIKRSFYPIEGPHWRYFGICMLLLDKVIDRFFNTFWIEALNFMRNLNVSVYTLNDYSSGIYW